MQTAQTVDSVTSIKRSGLFFFSGTMLSRIFGLLRDISLAYCFGNSADLSSFFIAMRLTYLLRRIFGEGALQSSFIPIFEEIKKENTQKAFSFFKNLTIVWIVLLTSVVCLGMFFIHTLCENAFFSNDICHILRLISLMLPSLIPICLFGLNISLLQSEKSYFLPGVAPIFFNICLIASAFLYRFCSQNGSETTYLAYGVVLGCFLQYLVTLIPTFFLTKNVLQENFFSLSDFCLKHVKKLLIPLTLSLIGIGASQLNNAIDALFAYNIEGGGPAQLWFSIRFYQLPLALFGIAISNAILPPLCRAFRANDMENFRSFLEHGMRQTVALLLPCTLALLIAAEYTINCFYGHGSFSQTDVIHTAICLQGYILGLIPSGLILIFAPAFYAQKQYNFPIIGATIALILNPIQNGIFVYGLHLGALSITIATSISSLLNCLYLYKMLGKKISLSEEGKKELQKTVLICIAAAIVTYALCSYLFTSPILFSAGSNQLSQDFRQQVAQLSICLSIFASVTLGGAYFCKATDLLEIVLPFLRFGKKKAVENKREVLGAGQE